MSAPNSIGRKQYGVMKVLSMMTITPCEVQRNMQLELL